jgi:hypothetical protein
VWNAGFVEQRGDVVVVQPVDDLAAGALTDDQAESAQHPQLVRDGWGFHVDGVGQISDRAGARRAGVWGCGTRLGVASACIVTSKPGALAHTHAAARLIRHPMLALWLQHRQASATVGGSGAPVVEGSMPTEQHFPVSIVVAHGLVAATTLVLVLLAALKVGGS